MDRSLLKRSCRAPRTRRWCRSRWRLRVEWLEPRHLLASGVAFQTPQALAGATEVSVLTSADLNGDDWLDVVVATRESTNIAVLLGSAEGTFGRPIRFNGRTGINALAAVDVDGDGDLDLIAGGGEGQNAGFSVLRNLGVDGQAWAGLETPINVVRAESPTALVARDFDGDGHVDVALASTADVSVFLGQGDGTFGDPISYAAGPGRRSLAAGHFDADGDLDLVVANDSSGQVTVLMGSGDGTFEPHDEVVTLSVLGQGWNLVAGRG